jgi:hypothetical protein
VYAYTVSYFSNRPQAAVGIYTNLGGTLHALADPNTTLPGTGMVYSSFLNPSVEGNTVAFGGSNAAGTAVLIQTGANTPTIAVNQNMPIPGGTGDFTFLNAASYSNSRLAFLGGGINPFDYGVYLKQNGQISTIVRRDGGAVLDLTGVVQVDSTGDVIYSATKRTVDGSTTGFYSAQHGKIIGSGDTLMAMWSSG